MDTYLHVNVWKWYERYVKLYCAGQCTSYCVPALLCTLLQFLLQPSCLSSVRLKALGILLLCCLAVMQQHGSFVSFWWCKDVLKSNAQLCTMPM